VVVEPIDLAVDELVGEETALGEDLSDLFLLGSLGREGRRFVTATESAFGGLGGIWAFARHGHSHGVLADTVGGRITVSGHGTVYQVGDLLGEQRRVLRVS
jgi:hypothetical protein